MHPTQSLFGKWPMLPSSCIRGHPADSFTAAVLRYKAVSPTYHPACLYVVRWITAETLARQFTRARPDRFEEVPHTLVAMGQAGKPATSVLSRVPGSRSVACAPSRVSTQNHALTSLSVSRMLCAEIWPVGRPLRVAWLVLSAGCRAGKRRIP